MPYHTIKYDTIGRLHANPGKKTPHPPPPPLLSFSRHVDYISASLSHLRPLLESSSAYFSFASRSSSGSTFPVTGLVPRGRRKRRMCGSGLIKYTRYLFVRKRTTPAGEGVRWCSVWMSDGGRWVEIIWPDGHKIRNLNLVRTG